MYIEMYLHDTQNNVYKSLCIATERLGRWRSKFKGKLECIPKKSIEFSCKTQYTFFFYKNLVHKNIKALDGPKIKNNLRSYEGFKS